ncbi:MarR family winged helix-turn-helix transcriptional regulator [Ruegeria profundi]|uniref:MarR family transcriptional regulator n=1 Tax=Ruegeria profundi TaxID=1685378 RepID=A0A0X3TQA6_9RHOB|nr:MarR family winged helix-turn-helix transcriptional regulator [Ruegeria profundi]KUJ77221.1 MarR family transcriptional regulator [Ruegeria profundi]
MITPDPQTTRIWTSLLNTGQALLEGIESELKNNNLPRLGWYDVLLEIEKAGPNGIRPYELKERLLLPQYGLSRMLGRIAEAGLITREEVENDGRGQTIKLTPKGLAIREAMWPIYAEMLVNSIQDKLSKSEAAELERILRKLGAGS